MEEIEGWDQFSTFSQALEATGLKDTLAGDGPFTVFAPTDDAFAQLPEGAVDELMTQENRDQLEGLLRHHVVEGKRLASNAIPKRIEPMEGGEITATMSGGELILGGSDDQRARVIGDIPAENGVIHAIDSVLMTQDVRDLLDGQPRGRTCSRAGQAVTGRRAVARIGEPAKPDIGCWRRKAEASERGAGQLRGLTPKRTRGREIGS